MLVATTIIERGIDNPHTNTLIIEDSQRLGLAQLYQLKGRVGRSHVKAYAYFLFPRDARRSPSRPSSASPRSASTTELGSGIKVAMRDLEIRGAGSLLGAEQSGNMSRGRLRPVRADAHEAVTEARGEPVVAHPRHPRRPAGRRRSCPRSTSPDVDERVRYYRRLAGSPTIEAVDADRRRARRDVRRAARAGPQPRRHRAHPGDGRRGRRRPTSPSSGSRLTVSPLSLSTTKRGQLAALGAVCLEREKKLALPTGVWRVCDARGPRHARCYTRTCLTTLIRRIRPMKSTRILLVMALLAALATGALATTGCSTEGRCRQGQRRVDHRRPSSTSRSSSSRSSTRRCSGR